MNGWEGSPHAFQTIRPWSAPQRKGECASVGGFLRNPRCRLMATASRSAVLATDGRYGLVGLETLSSGIRENSGQTQQRVGILTNSATKNHAPTKPRRTPDYTLSKALFPATRGCAYNPMANCAQTVALSREARPFKRGSFERISGAVRPEAFDP